MAIAAAGHLIRDNLLANTKMSMRTYSKLLKEHLGNVEVLWKMAETGCPKERLRQLKQNWRTFLGHHGSFSAWRPDYVHWDGVLGGRDSHKERSFWSLTNLTNRLQTADSAVLLWPLYQEHTPAPQASHCHGQPFNQLICCHALMLAGDSTSRKWCEGCEFQPWSPERQSGLPGQLVELIHVVQPKTTNLKDICGKELQFETIWNDVFDTVDVPRCACCCLTRTQSVHLIVVDQVPN